MYKMGALKFIRNKLLKGFDIEIDHLKFLFDYAKPYKKKMIIAVLTALPIAAISGLLVWSVKQITQVFTQGESALYVFLWLGVAMASVIFKGGLEVFNRYLLTVLFMGISHDIRLDLYQIIHDSPLNFHTQMRTGDVANLMNNDVQFAGGGMLEIYFTIWQHPITILGLLGMMIYLNPLMSLIFFCMLPIFSVSTSNIGRKAREAEYRFMEHQGQMLAEMVESLINVRQTKQFGLKEKQTHKIAREGNQLIHFRKQATLLSSFISPITDIVVCTAISVMAVAAYFQIQKGLTTPDAIAGCLMAAVALVKPIKALSNSIVILQRTFAAVRRIMWATQYQKKSKLGQKEVVLISQIQLKNVTFSYDGHRNILSGLNLEFNSGERIAIIGTSGAGKSTLMDLIIGFYPCSSGKILINGIDLAEMDLVSWQSQIGVVSQEPFLFKGTIYENVQSGNPVATSDMVENALNKAGCNVFLNRLPKGVQSQVGERGILLSGGERKRVALARALVRPISVLILDEATSELDIETEAGILKVIDKLAGEKLILHVSHRPTVLSHCDRGVLIKNGTAQCFSPHKPPDWINI